MGNTAWNALLYGAKKWFLYPPKDMIMSNRQILEFVETDMEAFANRKNHPVKPTVCTQTAGDVLIVPEAWGHGVLNLQESVAVATELKGTIRHPEPMKHIMRMIPDNNIKPRPNRKFSHEIGRDPNFGGPPRGLGDIGGAPPINMKRKRKKFPHVY